MQTIQADPTSRYIEDGCAPQRVLDLSAHHGRLWPADPKRVIPAFEDIRDQYAGRDDEPIVGAAATQFADEGLDHPERYDFLVDWLARANGQCAPGVIVDAGTGPAFLAAKLSERWPDAHIIGIDISGDMVNLARARYGRLDIRQHDIRTLPEMVHDVGAIVSRRMIHRVDDIGQVFEGLVAPLAAGRCMVNYSFRRPTSEADVRSFLEAAERRRQQPDLYAAFVRAVVNAPTVDEYAQAMRRTAARHGVRDVELLIYPFDVGVIVKRASR